MQTRILSGLAVPIFLLGIFSEGTLAAKRYKVPLLLPVDGAKLSTKYTEPSPLLYERGIQPDCEDINPEMGWDYVEQIDEWGATYFDYQQQGSMGRMIAVSSGGQRHMVFHETEGDYVDHPRYITYNCKNPLDQWCGPLRVDGGSGINAGYGQMLLLHDGREVILFHHARGDWKASLAVGEEGYPCECNFTKLYDLPDVHQNPVSPKPNGYWPKGCIVYDAEADTDYIHIVTTEDAIEIGADKTIAYQRCIFQGNNLICCSPGMDSCYTTPPNTSMGLFDRPIAVIDTIKTYSAVVVSSPVSEKVAIVYTKHRGNNQVNNDVFYIESTDNGQDWLNGIQWLPTKYNVTNYDLLWPERAFTDVAACYDYNDNLHIVWNSCYYDSAKRDINNDANLMHWCDTDPLGFENATVVASGYWDDGTVHPGAWNRNISKMSISAKDPIYHPGGDPDSVFLFCIWTQFNLGDNSLEGMTNGDIYASVSNDGGQSWASGYNLTNTKTPDCEPGECLSEHWSSLAENMYDGDLHIEYVCDRDAGGVVQPGEGTWTDNPMMYLHVDQLPVEHSCGISVSLVDPPSFDTPPIKVLPGEERVIAMELEDMYEGQWYEVTTDNPNVVPTLNGSGWLSAKEQKRVELTIYGSGEESFLNVAIYVHYCIETTQEDTIEFKLHVVQSSDYYECDRDPATFIEKNNDKLKLWVCCNTEQKLWDKRLPEPNQQIIFSSGVIVATTTGSDTVVGRQDYKDTRTGARDTIRVAEGDGLEPGCLIQKIHCTKTFICANNLRPPESFNHDKWWWISINKQIIFFNDLGDPPDTCPDWKKEQIIKYIWVTWDPLPAWWPDQSAYTGHEDIYLGIFADLDAPFDTGCDGCNTAGFDYQDSIMWQHGYNAETHPEYEDYYVGLALTDQDGNVVAPLGAQNVLNEEYIYPQEDWGWKEDELYQLAATPGVNIHYPDSVDDRTVVMTAGMIPAGSDTTFDLEFILIEALIKGGDGTGLAELKAHITRTREELIPELDSLGLFSRDFPSLICGNANGDGEPLADVADASYIINYLFVGGPPPATPWPFCPADANGDGMVDVADASYIINYLFIGAPPPTNCKFVPGPL